MNINEKNIGELLNDSFKKLESTATQDTKILTDMNNSLTWVLTISGFIFAFYGRQSSPSCYFDKVLFLIGNFIFSTLLFLLVVHKISLIQYEKIKNSYVENLRTHFLELKYTDFNQLKSRLGLSEHIFIAEFINKFRNGDFIEFPKADGRGKAFKEFDKKTLRLSWVIKFTFWAGMFLASIYLLDLICFLGKSI
jgi:hypothetical protein